jgi:D-sedoheptulose 7-phosphate isomerase
MATIFVASDPGQVCFGVVATGHRPLDTGKEPYLFPAADVLACGRLYIQKSLPNLEKVMNSCKWAAGRGRQGPIIGYSSTLPSWQQTLANPCPEGSMLSSLNLESLFTEALSRHLTVVYQLDTQRRRLEEIAGQMTKALLEGNKILWCGNGGSATDGQHLAAELVGRHRCDRPGLASIALTENSAAISGIANDYGFKEVFARQVEALCRPGDVFIGISASGNSRNVALALERAQRAGAYTVAITGEHGGRLGGTADTWLRIPSSEPARIQEACMLCGHMLCDWVEAATCISQAVKMQRNAG